MDANYAALEALVIAGDPFMGQIYEVGRLSL